jgi:negative regulator of sigma E activity
MTTSVNQQLSQFIDDELNAQAALQLLAQLHTDPDLHAQLQRYEAASLALKKQQFVPVHTDFVQSISQQLAHEPSYFLPQIKPVSTTKHSYQVAAYLAVAASVAFVALLLNRPHSAVSTPVAVVASNTTHTANKAVVIAHSDSTPPASVSSLNAQIREYLQNHPRLDPQDMSNLTQVTAYPQP